MNFNSQELYGLSNYKWVFSDLEIEELLLNMSSRNKIKFEKDSSIFRVKYILALLVLPISFIRILYVYCKQYFVVQSTIPHIKSVMLETGRGYELNNMHKVAKINDNNIIIQSFLLTDFMKHKRVGIRLLLKVLFNSISDFFHILSLKIPNRIAFLVIKIGIKNISAYSYYRSFFITLKSCHNNVTVYSDAALLQSHASIASKIRIVRTYHGLIDKINLNTFPEFDSIYVYSSDEKRYFENIGVTSKVYVYPAIKNKLHNKNVILFMADDASRVDSKELSDLIYQFKLHGYSIFMKMHPLHNVSREFKSEYGLEDIEWNNIFDTSELEILSGEDATFVLIEKQPSFVVGWQSTALCEALNSNVIPIMMSDSSRDTSLDVYPAERRALVWPVECNIIKNLLLNYSSYEDTIYMLKTR